MTKPVDRIMAEKRLRELSWSDLDWIEQACRRIKPSARGARSYHSGGDATHGAEAARSMADSLDDVFYKHHGDGYPCGAGGADYENEV